MTSRRTFISSNLLGGLALSLTEPASIAATLAPTADPGTPPDGNERDYWNDWPRYVTARMKEARAKRLAELQAMRTMNDVNARVERIRSTLWKLIGGPCEKTPLKPQIVGTIDRGEYGIEKVLFESRPEVFVTANLYIPKQHKPPYPGIIFPLGHADEGKAYYYYQYVCQNLARKGYAVLSFDPFGQGERKQYLDPVTGKGLSYPTEEHNRAGHPMLLFGSQLEQYLVWDGIRAVDYLCSRPDVDPERIGCTGNSGGGTMTMYMAALEPRIKVAVESDGNSENMAGPSYSPPGGVADAEQNIANSLPEGIDRGDLLLAFAPKPLLILYSRTDSGVTYGPNYVKGSKEIYREVETAYKLFGAADKVKIFGSPLPHAYEFFNRRQAYGWFNRWLGSEEWGTGEAPFDPSSPDALNCTRTGEVLTSLGGRSIIELNTERLGEVAPPSPPARAPDDFKSSRKRAQAVLKELLALPAQPTPLYPRIISSNIWRDDIAVDEFAVYSDPWVRVRGWFLRPAKGGTSFPTIVYVTEEGCNSALEETAEVGNFVRKGFAVCAVDLRGLGESTPRYPSAGPLFYRGEHFQEGYAWACFALGKPVLGQRVWDFVRCLDYLQTRRDVDQSRILAVGEKGTALAVLLSGVLDDRVHSMLLDSPVATYRSIVEAKDFSLDFSWFLFDVLKHFDIPDLAGLVAPRPCWVLNATNPQGEPLAESEVGFLYKYSVEAFKQFNQSGKFRIMVYPEQEKTKAYYAWLETA